MQSKGLGSLRQVSGLCILALTFFSLLASAQQVGRGTITGKVTADQGQVVAFRVAAHNVDRRLWYTVFTKKGQYVVPQALSGHYEISVDMRGYDSPKLDVQLAGSESKTADIAVTKKPDEAPRKIEWVNSLDEVFPPGPEKDLLKANCTGCHADSGSSWGRMKYDRDRFYKGIERMMNTGPGYNAFVLAVGRTPFSKQQKDMLADYLVKNFGPGTTEKRIRVDPIPLDEEVASKAIFVSYDSPADLQVVKGGDKIGAPMIDGVIEQEPFPKEGKRHHLGSTFISPLDGNIWHSSRASSSLIRLDPKNPDADRWKNYPIKGDVYVHPDGVGVDKQGHVYWAELKTGRLGELHPETGKMIRHSLPQQVGALHEAVVDKDGTVGFDLIWGAEFGRLDPKTGKIHMWPTPTPDNGLYGMVIDNKGNYWSAGWQKGTINKWDPKTELVTEYKVPNSWGQMRRIGADSKGIIWASEFITGILARLDPATGELTEFKIPYSGAKPYDAWADHNDNIWMGDEAHNVIIKFDQKTKKFSYYPMPQPGQSINKFQVADDNTIWFGSRAVPVVTSVHFYPDGFASNAVVMP
jgi:virginiamycin B lyase